MTAAQQTFITQIAPAAVEFYETHRISAALTIAQACVESYYGQHAPGANIFGVKADPSWHGRTVLVRTHECYDGKWVVISAKFRAYDSFAESLADHGNFLLVNPRYHNLIGADWETACNLIAKVDGYATDPHYGDTLIAVIRQFGLDKYDVAPPADGSYPTLKLGSIGAFVKTLQTALGIHADGVFGPVTLTAVKNFQNAHRLATDGVVGADTWAAIEQSHPTATVRGQKPV